MLFNEALLSELLAMVFLLQQGEWRVLFPTTGFPESAVAFAENAELFRGFSPHR
jgi:hypothetical protein